MKLKYCLVALLWPVLNGYSQMQAVPKALNPGDTLPDLLLKSVINSPDSNIQLSKLSAKLLLLDFWSVNCASCFHALPKLDSIKTANADVQIITVTQNDAPVKITRLLKRFPATRNFRLPVVTYDFILHSYFPHQLISHVVWLNKDRMVIAITGTDYVTGHNITQALKGEVLPWPVKRDVFNFDYTAPLLSFNPASPVKPPFYLYSTFAGHMEGIAPPTRILRDTIAGTTSITFYNLDLLSYCQLATSFQLTFQSDQFRMAVTNKNRFIQPAGTNRSDWEKQNSYCYSASFPLDISMAELKRIIQQDLKRWLEIFHVQIIPLKKSNPTAPRYEIRETHH